MSIKKKKIACVTGARADFGILTPVLKAVEASEKLELQLYATGVHLMPKFGNTIDEVRKIFPNVVEVPAIFETDDRAGMARFAGKFIVSLTSELEKNRPDFMFTPFDRVEALAASVACLYLGIPTGQFHGGEVTSTVDESARHAITKMTSIHFPATKESAERIKKMGEEEWRIHVVGAPALDTLLNEKLPSRDELFRELHLNPAEKIILVTQHAVSEEYEQASKQMEETLKAVKSFNLPVVMVYPNADSGGQKIIEVIDREKNNPQFHIFANLPHKTFLALEREAAVWVGNSSGAMIESSSFKTPVVNVGTRQSGRQRGENVIDAGYDAEEIKKAIEKSLNDKEYLARLQTISNPWGDGKASERTVKILEDLELGSKLLLKQITY